MLDNYHVVERHIAMIKKYLPWGFYRTLPKFKQGELKGFPRGRVRLRPRLRRWIGLWKLRLRLSAIGELSATTGTRLWRWQSEGAGRWGLRE